MVGNPDWATQPKEVPDLKTDYNLVKLMERTQNTDTDTQIHTHTSCTENDMWAVGLT